MFVCWYQEKKKELNKERKVGSDLEKKEKI